MSDEVILRSLIVQLEAALKEIDGIVTALLGDGAFPMTPSVAYEHVQFRARAALKLIPQKGTADSGDEKHG